MPLASTGIKKEGQNNYILLYKISIGRHLCRTLVLSHPALSRMEMPTEHSVDDTGRLLPATHTRRFLRDAHGGFSGTHTEVSPGHTRRFLWDTHRGFSRIQRELHHRRLRHTAVVTLCYAAWLKL